VVQATSVDVASASTSALWNGVAELIVISWGLLPFVAVL